MTGANLPGAVAVERRTRGPGTTGMLISGAAIGPDSPGDPKDTFALLVEGASEYAVFTLSPTGLVSTWNRGAERIKGYQRDEIVGRHFSAFYPVDQRDAGIPEAQLLEAVAEGHVRVAGWRLRQDGSRFWADVTITALWDQDGGLRGFAKLTRDESDRRAAEMNQKLARLDEQERIAATLADTMARRLFGVGLQLGSAVELANTAELRQKIEAAIEETDGAIRELRSAVFGLGPSQN